MHAAGRELLRDLWWGVVGSCGVLVLAILWGFLIGGYGFLIWGYRNVDLLVLALWVIVGTLVYACARTWMRLMKTSP